MKLIQYCLFVCAGLSVAAAHAQEVPVPKGRRLRTIVKEKYPENVYIGATTGYRSWEKGEGIILDREFSYITPNNDFKQSYVHPEPGKWRWDVPDRWVTLAKKNSQLIRMHAPISPQCSRWAKEDSRTSEELQKNLAEYMTALCKRYNDKKEIRWLDVVNETIGRKGEWFGPEPGTTQWENPWPKIGYEKNIPSMFKSLRKDGVPLYIIRAFEIATKHAPDLKLIINQHALIEPASARKLKDLVLYLRSRNLRVDGIGWQAHIKEMPKWKEKDSQDLKTLESLIDWAHKNDLEFHVTENNIHLSNGDSYNADTVSSVFENIVSSLLKKRDTGVVAWNLWTISDKPHFKNKNRQVLGFWDENLSPQKAYYVVQAVLESEGNQGAVQNQTSR
ncbi:MAG: endo-1,4-beta-xylanase [Lentisphaerae bacterium]|nr:endo-1,4-beta-xylanase [Lentisphaerota bacterium]